jgi:hypothetical protein
MTSLGGQSGVDATLARDADRARIANTTALDANTRTTGCAANRGHEDARSITGSAPSGKFSRTQYRLRVRPPCALARAAGANGDRVRGPVAAMARKSRRRFRKTQNQGMLVDPVVNRMLWT